jgi:hypothetical protein
MLLTEWHVRLHIKCFHSLKKVEGKNMAMFVIVCVRACVCTHALAQACLFCVYICMCECVCLWL